MLLAVFSSITRINIQCNWWIKSACKSTYCPEKGVFAIPDVILRFIGKFATLGVPGYLIGVQASRRIVMKTVTFLLCLVVSTSSFTADLLHGKPGTNYQTYGNITYGSDGSTQQEYGTTTYGSAGQSSQRLGNTTYNSNGSTSTQYGNTLYNSDGSTVQRYGNTTYGSDGTTCQTYGDQTYCN
jgi:hypothetical protein